MWRNNIFNILSQLSESYLIDFSSSCQVSFVAQDDYHNLERKKAVIVIVIGCTSFGFDTKLR